ncbi:DUF1549 and DUF1553 domain-containing protein [Stieleria varia]|uniref:Bacterial Ig-like domain (Group 2) n=1 Tax=Stieleria varia TaxID=2528005 RepID=A0A5C6A353_9BACT|nr:DUF1549 and DUF1553 domain-containing protein [Stieleria varia]TWT93969.1 hypothetical protein Pla52n_57980 [Stieleria varia]
MCSQPPASPRWPTWSTRGPILACWFLAINFATWCCSSSHGAEPGSVSLASAIHQPISFQLDIQPILTARGCNAGACHGKQRGQNGFQLSLLGFDSEFDHNAIVRSSRGRRLSLTAPHESLLLQKATATVPHGGGVKIEPGSSDHLTLLRWIEQGAKRSVPNEPVLESVVLGNDEFVMSSGQTAELSLTATYSDGSQRTVTSQATYLSNDPAVVSVDAAGRMLAGSLPGETAIMARYMNHICVANAQIPREQEIPASVFHDLPRNGFIDELVFAKLQSLRIKPSEPAEEWVFLRRVFTDLIGRLPRPEEAREFLESADPGKREHLVDWLLSQREYADHWANQWADLLRPNPYRVGIKAVLNYDNWIRQQFRENLSHDEFARRLVTARGSTWRNGAVTLYRDRRSPDEMATLVSQLLLGVRLECAKCHHHPFESYSQADFYQFAAFFGKVAHRGTGLSPPISGGEEIIWTSESGTVKHPVSGEIMTPTPLFGSVDLSQHDDPRVALAQWMTTDNPLFAKVHVNRLWAHMMGRGLVEPVDDLRSTNPPSNPQLLDALADHFREIGYDQKQMLRTIALSNVYALSSIPNETNSSDRLNHSRHYRQRLRAEILSDAISDITLTPTSFTAMPTQSKANQIWTTRVDSVFLDTFGRPNENQDPPCERIPDTSVTQTLHLMNSRELSGRITNDDGRVAQLASSDRSATEIIDELYLAVYSRYPSEGERQYAESLIATAGENRRGAIEDLMWAMLNTPEFSIQN